MSYLLSGSAVLIIVVAASQFLKREPANSQMPPGEGSKKETHSEGLLFTEALRTTQFWLVYSLAICYGICFYVIMVHIAAFATDINISPASAAVSLSIIGAASIPGKVIFGRIGDKIKKRSVYITSYIIMILAYILLLSSTGAWTLYLFAGIFAFGYAGLSVVQSPMTAALFGLKSHGAIWGAVNFGFMVGGAIGPVMAGYIFDTTGNYRLAFLISAGIAVLGLMLSLGIKPVRKTPVSAVTDY